MIRRKAVREAGLAVAGVAARAVARRQLLTAARRAAARALGTSLRVAASAIRVALKLHVHVLACDKVNCLGAEGAGHSLAVARTRGGAAVG